MLNYFVQNFNEEGTFFWNSKIKDNDFVAGISITSDKYMVVSLTFGSDDRTYDQKILDELMRFLNTPYGFFSYYDYPTFKSGEKFKKTCSELNVKNGGNSGNKNL